MEHEFVDGRLRLRRTQEEREPLIARLKRIEGQVRGLQLMLEQDRYCGDELQQANAVIAAMREVALLVASQHLAAGIEHAVRDGDASAVLEELKAVMRTAMKQN